MAKSKKNNGPAYLGFKIWHASNTWQRNMKAALDPLGVTHVQYLLLEHLAAAPDASAGISQSKLSEYAQTDHMMTSKVLRHLATRKLIQRKPSKMDSRAILVNITPAGNKVLARARKAVLNVEKETFAKVEKQSKLMTQLDNIQG